MDLLASEDVHMTMKTGEMGQMIPIMDFRKGEQACFLWTSAGSSAEMDIVMKINLEQPLGLFKCLLYKSRASHTLPSIAV